MDALDLTTGERLSGMKFLAKGSRRKATAPQRRQHDEDETGVENRSEMIKKTETSSLNGNDDDMEDGVETPPRPSSEGSARPVESEMEQPGAKPAFIPGSNLLGEFAQKILAVRTELARTNSPLYDRDRHFPLNVNNNSSNSPADSPDVNSVDSESRQSDITPRPPTSHLLPFPLMGPSGLAVDDLMQQRLRRYLNDVQPAEAPGIPERTKKQNRWAFNVWREWARKRNSLEDSFTGPYKGVPLDVGQATEEELDYWLCKFVMEIRRKDGNPYPPHTLMQIVMGIQRYLRQQAGKPSICILDRSNATYSNFRSVLDYRIKELTNNGATSLKSRYRPVLLGDIDDKYGRRIRKGPFPDNFNWKDSIMDTDTAQGLLNAVFWHNYKSFGIQYIDDHWNLRAENFQIHGKGEGNGVSILEFTPSVNSMMATSGKVNGMRVMPKKIYPDNPDDREIFNIYQKYLSHIPQSGPFYRHPVDPTIVDRSIKFSDQWVGKNRLRAMLKHLIDVGANNNRLKTDYPNASRHISRSVDSFVTPMMQLSSGPLNFPPAALQGNVDLPKATIQLQNQQRNQSNNSVTSKEIDEDSFGDSDSGPPSPKRTKSDAQADTRIGSSSTNGSTRSRNASNDDAALEIAVPKTIKSITVVKGGRKITFHLD